jgi:membrane associated rhomboid family serine protease
MKATLALFIICVFVTLYGWHSNPVWVADNLCFSSTNLSEHRYWTLVTALFMHGSWMHLLGNMLALLIFGSRVEHIVGPKKMLISFFTGGVIGMLLGRYYYPLGESMIGASGAICTFIAILLLFDPWRWSIILTIIPMPLGAAGIFYLLLNIYLSAHHNLADNDGASKVAYEMHVIGFFIGIIFGAVWSPHWKKNLLLSVLLFILTIVFYYYLFRFLRMQNF